MKIVEEIARAAAQAYSERKANKAEKKAQGKDSLLRKVFVNTQGKKIFQAAKKPWEALKKKPATSFDQETATIPSESPTADRPGTAFPTPPNIGLSKLIKQYSGSDPLSDDKDMGQQRSTSQKQSEKSLGQDILEMVAEKYKGKELSDTDRELLSLLYGTIKKQPGNDPLQQGKNVAREWFADLQRQGTEYVTDGVTQTAGDLVGPALSALTRSDNLESIGELRKRATGGDIGKITGGISSIQDAASSFTGAVSIEKSLRKPAEKMSSLVSSLALEDIVEYGGLDSSTSTILEEHIKNAVVKKFGEDVQQRTRSAGQKGTLGTAGILLAASVFYPPLVPAAVIGGAIGLGITELFGVINKARSKKAAGKAMGRLSREPAFQRYLQAKTQDLNASYKRGAGHGSP